MPKAIVIIPVFNEDPIVVQQVLASLVPLGHAVVVVDDGSERPIAPYVENGNIKTLRHGINLGQGAALQTGFDYALRMGADFVITFDADGQHSADSIESLLAPLLRGESDIVFGSRFLHAEKLHIPLRRKWLLQAARYVNYGLTGVLLTDAHNGLRALNKAALRTIRLSENRMAHASEILLQAQRKGLRIGEAPVQVSYTPYARRKGQSGWSGVRVLFDLLLHKLFS